MRYDDFQIGDRIVITEQHHNLPSEIHIPAFGTVQAKDDDIRTLGIRFDEAVEQCHTLDGRCEQHHGWWFWPSELYQLEPIDDTESVIFIDETFFE